MAFNVDASLEAFASSHECWALQVRNLRFEAKPWSAQQALIMQDSWRRLPSNEERRELWHKVLRQSLFPWHVSYIWLGDPVKIYHKLPAQLQMDALADFFVFLARINAKDDQKQKTPLTVSPQKMDYQFTPKVRQYYSQTSGQSVPTTTDQS